MSSRALSIVLWHSDTKHSVEIPLKRREARKMRDTALAELTSGFTPPQSPRTSSGRQNYSPATDQTFLGRLGTISSHLEAMACVIDVLMCSILLSLRHRGRQNGPTRDAGGAYNFAVPSSSFHVAWRGHSAAVSSLSWIHSPPSLLSSSADGLAKIWTADGSALLGQVKLLNFTDSRWHFAYV